MSLADAGILARAIDAVRVNACRRAARGDGRPVWVKRRRLGGDAAILAGNTFLAASNSRIRMFASAARWRRRETTSFRLLHGDAHACGPHGPRGLWFDELPGVSLRELATRGALEDGALAAAGREFARAHALACPLLRGRWSHGDPHLGNVLFDAATSRARLIDFETEHERHLPSAERHADDLLTFLLELAARSAKSTWPGRAQTFVLAYAPPPAVRLALARRLRIPVGLERVLWQTRTEYMATPELTARLVAIRRLLATAGETAPATANRVTSQ